MTYQIRVHRIARLDIRDAYEWAYRRAPNTADRWLDRFREAIRTLETAPNRLPLAPESRKVSLELRELHFGRRPNVFRVIFYIDVDSVRILRIRRGQRRLLTRGEIDTATSTDEGP